MESPESEMDKGEIEAGQETELQRTKKELEKTKSELDDAKSEVAVSQILQENLCSVSRQKSALEEELATMQILLSEATMENQDNLVGRLKTKYSQLKAENQDLKVQLSLLEGRRESSGETGESILGGAAVLSGVTKNIARRVKSSVQTVIPAGTGVTLEEKEMEENMARARQGAEALKEIVMPLEEQIVALKGKLRETDGLLQEYERRQAVSLMEMEAVASWLEGRDRAEVEERLITEVGDGYSGGEGELYHAMLAARIGMLVQEMEAVKWERDLQSKEIEQERKAVTGYREQVERMQGVVAVSREQVERIKSQLTDQQKEQLGSLWAEEVEDRGVEGNRVISQGEWKMILSRLDAVMVETGSQSEACKGEEVEKLRAELKELTKERDHLASNCDKYKEDLKNEAAFRKEMEVTWNSRGQQYTADANVMEDKLRTTEQAMMKMNAAYMALAEATRRDLQTLTKDREKIVKELKRLQGENDNLVGKHSVLAETMASETINLPNKLEDMQLLLLTYREDLIAAKIGKERAQERLKSEVAFMKAQLVSEQQSKAALQRDLEQELEEAKHNVVDMELTKRELDIEKGQRKTLEADLQKVETRQNQASLERDEQVQAAQTDHDGLTIIVTQLKNKVASLQVDLDNSVAVQNDFVRLSQSLQVELEKIRQAEKEVRWQHEEDVDDCGSCRTAFSVTRRKHHCRHCGRVYCSDCVAKQVPSGPQGRSSRVCDVCHTLLSHHSAPYFSTEAPSME